MFDQMYDKANTHCNKCGWDGIGEELKDGKCPVCDSEKVEEIESADK